MHFVYIKVFDRRYKEDVILALQSAGISRASFVEAQNLEAELSDDIGLFKGFFDPDRHKGEEGLIFALAEETEQISEVIANLRAAGLALDDEEVIRILAWPVSYLFDPVLGTQEP